MTEKVVSVRLQARVEGFTAGMRKAKASVDDLTKADVPKAAKGYSDLANKAAMAGAAIGVGLGVAVKRFADFDQAMSAVKANSGATAENLKSLRESALKLGADSQFSATEAAQGINELAKAGVSTANILNGGLKGALDLAAAGQISVADAAESTASALGQFGLDGNAATHVADLLSNAASSAQGGVSDMAAALANGGVAAKAAGLNIDETATILAVFAKSGLVGAEAGTALKTMMTRLAAPTDAAAAKMAELGIAAYDAQGQFIGAEQVMGQLAAATKGMGEQQRAAAFDTIFGSFAITAAGIAANAGAQGYAAMEKEVTRFGGAAEQAADLTDNLKGDIERLGGAFDTVLIGSGSGANDSLRSLVQSFQGLVETVGRIPGPLLLAGAGLTAMALVVPKGVGAFRDLGATMKSVGLGLDNINAKAPRTGKALGVAAKGAGVATKAFLALAAAGVATSFLTDDVQTTGVQKLTADLANATDAVAAFDANIKKTNADQGFIQGDLENFGDVLRATFDPDFLDTFNRKGDAALGAMSLGLIDLTTTTDDAAAKMGDLDGILSGLVSSGNTELAASMFARFATEAAKSGVNTEQLMTKLPGYADLIANVGTAAAGAVTPSSALAGATADIQTEAEKADDALTALKNALDGLGSPAAQARAAQRDFQSSLNDSEDAVDTYRESLIKKAIADGKGKEAAAKWADAQIAAGRAMKDNSDEALGVQASLDAIRQATLDKVLADYQLTGSTDSATAAMEKGKAAFIKAATEAGYTKTQAEALATQLGLIPDDVAVLVSQSGAEAAGAAITGAAVDRYSTIWVSHRFRGTDLSSEFQGVGGRASGGPIWGAGTKTSDSIPIWASHGEFMQKAAAVDKYGLSFMNAVNTLQFPTSLARGYATGGPIAPQYAPAMAYAGPTSYSTRNDYGLTADQVTIVTQDAGSFKRELRSTSYRAKARPGR